MPSLSRMSSTALESFTIVICVCLCIGCQRLNVHFSSLDVVGGRHRLEATHVVFPHSYRSASLLICEASSSIVSPAVHDFFCRRQTMSRRRHRAHRPDRASSAVTHFTLTLRQFAHALLCRTVLTNCALSSSPLRADPVVFCRFLGWSDCSGDDPRSPCRWFIVLPDCRALNNSLKPLPCLRKPTTRLH